MALQSGFFELRGRDLNPRPSGYEPDELPAAPPRAIVLALYIKLTNTYMISDTAVNVKKKKFPLVSIIAP